VQARRRSPAWGRQQVERHRPACAAAATLPRAARGPEPEGRSLLLESLCKELPMTPILEAGGLTKSASAAFGPSPGRSEAQPTKLDDETRSEIRQWGYSVSLGRPPGTRSPAATTHRTLKAAWARWGGWQVYRGDAGPSGWSWPSGWRWSRSRGRWPPSSTAPSKRRRGVAAPQRRVHPGGRAGQALCAQRHLPSLGAGDRAQPGRRPLDLVAQPPVPQARRRPRPAPGGDGGRAPLITSPAARVLGGQRRTTTARSIQETWRQGLDLAPGSGFEHVRH
jgi:hypothetical protein